MGVDPVVLFCCSGRSALHFRTPVHLQDPWCAGTNHIQFGVTSKPQCLKQINHTS